MANTDSNEVRAVARYVRIAPRKARAVVDLIRNKPVDKALEILQFTKRAAAYDVSKVLRSAIANAFSHGCRSFVRGAVIADSGDYCTPCGICRQLLYEFSDNLVMLCCKGDGSYLALTAEELLPHGFKAERMT